MTSFETLLATYCPQGVKLLALNQLGTLDNIGVNKKKDLGKKSVWLLNYLDVYHHRFIDHTLLSMQISTSKEKFSHCSLEKGDLLMTPTSETKTDLLRTAVVVDALPNTVYSYHIARFRLFNQNLITSKFISLLFETPFIKSQIAKTAIGLTRFCLTKEKFETLKIPFPPLAIQSEIVRILTPFICLESTLKSELILRKKQYQYYLKAFLHPVESFASQPLSKLCEKIVLGKNKSRKASGIFPVYGTTHQIGYSDTFSYSCPALLVARVGSHAGFVYKVSGKYAVSSNVLILRPKAVCNIDFLYYQLTYSGLHRLAVGGGQPLLTIGQLNHLLIPVPPLKKQQAIVQQLSPFNTLINDRLPQEIAARTQQYTYYRNALLTFKTLTP